MDWILEMYSQDHPEELKFERASTREARMHFTSSSVRWTDVLTGAALARFTNKFVPSFLRNSAKNPLPGVTPPSFSGPGAEAFKHANN